MTRRDSMILIFDVIKFELQKNPAKIGKSMHDDIRPIIRV